MIYVEEKDFSRQIELLAFLANTESYSICAWLYPESKASSIASLPLISTKLESVTTYGDGTKPRHTELTSCSNEIFKILRAEEAQIRENCDNLALYKKEDNSWHAVTVGHEGMCLVRDDELLETIEKAGFSASREAPSWW